MMIDASKCEVNGIKMGEMTTIGTRLREVLTDCRLNMSELSKRSGLPYRSVQNYSADAQKPGADALLKLRETLGVSIDWLLTGVGQKFADTRSNRSPAQFGYLEDIYQREAKSDWDVMMLFTEFFHDKDKLKANMLESLRQKQNVGNFQGVDLESLSFGGLYDLYRQTFGDKAPFPDSSLPDRTGATMEGG